MSNQYAVRFETLGCRLNQIETEGAAKVFFDAGFIPCFSAGSVPKDAVLILCVVNTCAVTGKAEQKARRTIRLLLQTYPSAAILLTGCYAQLNGLFLSAMDARICVLSGTRKSLLAEIPAKLMNILKSEETAKSAVSIAGFLSSIITSSPCLSADSPFLLSTDTFFAHSRPLIKIQDGCDNECAYCAIRLARGKSVSLDASSVVHRIQALEKKGLREVSLTGVNLCRYNGEYQGRCLDFTELLELILAHTSNIALRLSSLHPDYIDARFCAVVQNERIRPHFHLSVQSGSDHILAAMKRAYTSRDTLDAVLCLRDAKEKPFIASDIIVGFPGESSDDFDATVELCKKSNFAWIHIFPFSKRPGTAAFNMKGEVKSSVIRERAEVLRNLAVAGKIAYVKSFEGQILPVITESTRLRGVTDNFIHVEVSRPAKTVRIVKMLEECIKNDGETEAVAEYVE